MMYLDKHMLTFINTTQPLLCSQGRRVPGCHWIDVLLVWLRLEANTGRINPRKSTGIAPRWRSLRLSPCGARSWRAARWGSWWSPVCRTWTPRRSWRPGLSLASHLREDAPSETLFPFICCIINVIRRRCQNKSENVWLPLKAGTTKTET